MSNTFYVHINDTAFRSCIRFSPGHSAGDVALLVTLFIQKKKTKTCCQLVVWEKELYIDFVISLFQMHGCAEVYLSSSRPRFFFSFRLKSFRLVFIHFLLL